jgi:serine/threonine-protein kinase
VPTDAEDDLRFLQDRLALYAATVTLISGAFLVLGVLVHLALSGEFDQASRIPHIAGTAVMLNVWLLVRGRRTHSLRALQILDAVGTVGSSLMFAWMAYQMASPIGTAVGLLAISFITLGRAAQLPSTPKRTVLLAALSFVGILASPLFGPIQANLPQTFVGRLVGTLDPFLWSLSGTALATVASKVIYGLQEKVLEARQLGQYTLDEKIGEGGMGEIYRARHAMLRRPTAIKLVRRGQSEQLKRFEREVQLTALLRHPNTISVYDYGRTPDGTFYYAMELLEGMNLETLVERHGAQPPGRVVHVLLQICGALAEAHGVGLIHRDIKPANVYLCRHGGLDDFVKVLDFGLVRQIENGKALTETGSYMLAGTPLYMAPEAIVSPNEIDARADLYSLGALAYHLLTGSPPFTAGSVVEVCSHHLHTEPESLSERLGRPIPEALERVVLACLAKDPDARPQSASELASVLRTMLANLPWAPADALSFWQGEARMPSPSPKKTSARTIRLDMAERMKRSLRERAPARVTGRSAEYHA